MFIKIPKYANEWRSCVILCMYYKFISKCSWGLCSAGHHIHYDCTPLFVCSQFSKSDRVNILFSSVSVDWTSAWLGCIQLPALPGMFQWSGRLDAMVERLHVVLERTSLDGRQKGFPPKVLQQHETLLKLLKSGTISCLTFSQPPKSPPSTRLQEVQ